MRAWGAVAVVATLLVASCTLPRALERNERGRGAAAPTAAEAEAPRPPPTLIPTEEIARRMLATLTAHGELTQRIDAEGVIYRLTSVGRPGAFEVKSVEVATHRAPIDVRAILSAPLVELLDRRAVREGDTPCGARTCYRLVVEYEEDFAGVRGHTRQTLLIDREDFRLFKVTQLTTFPGDLRFLRVSDFFDHR